MKTKEEIRAEFEAWYSDNYAYSSDAESDRKLHMKLGYEAGYQACAATYEAQFAEKDAIIARLREALANYACESDCWADSKSGNNPLIGNPNESFCHKEYKGETCGKKARKALEQPQ